MFEMVKSVEIRKNGLKVNVYTKEAETFRVEVRHRVLPTENPPFIIGGFGNNCWYLYVYIYPANKLFDELHNCESMDCDKGNEVYPDFHCGCTYFKVKENEIIIGCDYLHITYIDEAVSRLSELPDEISADAEHLYNYFKELEEK